MTDRKLVIAIDGPAGAGKSTVAKLVAERLGYLYIDTGAMYRAIAYKALEAQLDLTDELMLGQLAASSEVILVQGSPGAPIRVCLDGRDVSSEIRSPEVNLAVSLVAKVPQVRESMVKMQRQIATHGGVVMDGRDIGTVVFPDADHKFFLTATLEERARRRELELGVRGHQVSYQAVLADVSRRDKIDSERAVAPLRVAEGAVVVDTTGLEIDDVVQRLLALIQEG